MIQAKYQLTHQILSLEAKRKLPPVQGIASVCLCASWGGTVKGAQRVLRAHCLTS